MNRLVLAMVAVTSLAAFAAPARTQSPESAVLARYRGLFRNPLEDGGASRIRGEIEAVVATMPLVRGNAARRRLVASDPPIFTIRFTPEGAGLIIDYTRGRYNVTPALGVWVTTAAAGGGEVDVRHRVVGDTLHETYRHRRGGAEHVFSLSSGGDTLQLDATIESPFLPRPIVYHLSLARVSS